MMLMSESCGLLIRKCASPRRDFATLRLKRDPRDRFDGDLLIPEVEVDHSVTGPAERSIGKEHVGGQSPELGPKNAVRLVAVLEHALPPSQPGIEGKNELRPQGPRAVCSRSILNATRGTCPKCPRVVPSVENRQMASG